AALIDLRLAAVPEVAPRPYPGGIHVLGSIVLGAADHEVRIRRVVAEALELGGVEPGVVEARPRRSRVDRLEDAAVAALVDDGRVRGRHRHGVAVGVETGAYAPGARAESRPAVGRARVDLGAGAVRGAAEVDLVGVAGIHGDEDVVEALAAAEAVGGRDRRRPGDSPVDRPPQLSRGGGTAGAAGGVAGGR